MPSISIACGTLLILIGIVGYVYGMTTGHASITALIPALFGVLLVVLGVLGRMRENLRKHLMHAAVLIALIGFILPFGRLISRLGEITLSAAVISQISMAAVCLVFVVLSIQSFINARRGGSV
jgi:hypothetical protein